MQISLGRDADRRVTESLRDESYPKTVPLQKVPTGQAVEDKMPMEATVEHPRHYARGDHQIYQGDALAVLRDIPNESIDLIFADPPYNIGKRFGSFHDSWPNDESYADWCYDWLSLCIDKLRTTGSLFVMSSTQCMPYLDLFLRKRMTVKARICWHYDSSGVQARKYYGSTYEPLLFCVKDSKSYYFDADSVKVEARTGSTRRLIDYRKEVPTQYSTHKVPGNVWYFPRVRYRMQEYEEHPSQKPESLLERIILGSCPPAGIVLDPFAGTFTTGAVAKRLGRSSIGIETQQEYVKIGLRRLGIQDHLDGEPLRPTCKNFARRAKNVPAQVPLLGT